MAGAGSIASRWRTLTALARRALEFVVLFVILRTAVGLGMIVFTDTAVAWSWQLTVIVAGAVATYTLVALALRRPSARRP
jgi:branched-subunit amino acid transport protein